MISRLILLCSLSIICHHIIHAQDYKTYLDLSFREIDSLSAIAYQKGNLSQGILYMKAAQHNAAAQFGQKDPKYVDYTVAIAFFYSGLGRYEDALPLYIRAKEMYEALHGKNHPSYGNALNNLAMMYRRMGDYERTLPLLVQANDILEANAKTKRQRYFFAVSLNNLATVYQDMGNYEGALPILLKTKGIFEEVLEGETMKTSLEEFWRFSSILSNLANAYQKTGDLEKALSLYIQARELRIKASGEDHPLTGITNNNIGALYRELGQYDKSLLLFMRAAEIQREKLGTNHPEFVNVLNNLAILHKEMGNYDLAWETLAQAMNGVSNVSMKHDFSAVWSDSLAQIDYPSYKHTYRMTVALSRVYEYLEEDSTSTDIINKQIRVANLSSLLLTKAMNQVANEQDKLRALSQSIAWVLRSLRVWKHNKDKYAKDAFNRADQNKSVLLLKSTKSETAYRLGNVPDSLIRQNEKLLKKKSKLQAKLAEKRSQEEKDKLTDRLNDINIELDTFVKMLEQNYPKYYSLKYQQLTTQSEEIQASLDDKTALIEYVIGDSTVHIFGVTKENIQWKTLEIKKKELGRYIDELHQALSDYKLIKGDKNAAYQKYTTNASWFYQNLLAPVLKDQNQIKKLIIVTDGELGHLPFETFLVEPAPETTTDYNQLHYLINDYTITYNYSARLWKENKEAPRPQNNGQILGLAANYAIVLDTSMMGLRLPTDQWMREGLMALPAARKEVENLQKQYEGYFLFDTLASEKIVKECAKDFAVLHFAVHGILDKKRPVLSALAFTEDSDSLESNFWQAHEISKMRLNANLVVLSACETGYGTFERGNGIASLARAFTYAGASSLVVSLWQINDGATSIVMNKFYDNLSQKMNVDEALRQAKLNYIQRASGRAAHPAFWSSFIQMGNTAPISIQKKRKESILFWGIAGTLVLVVLIGIGLKRRGK